MTIATMVRMWLVATRIAMSLGVMLRSTTIVVTLRLATMVVVATLRSPCAILAAHRCYLRQIHIQLLARHNADITDYRVVVWMLVVELITLGAHITCYVGKFGCRLLGVMLLGDETHETLSILAIVLEHNALLWI